MIPDSLKQKVFMVIEQQLPVKVFEAWLYDQQDLSEKTDNELILDLFSFNYNQQAARFEFKKDFQKRFDEEEFMLWKIKANLSDLIAGKETTGQILHDLNYRDHDTYPFLERIGSYVYYFEDTEYDINAISQDLKQDAAHLLQQIEEGEKRPGFKISGFRSDPAAHMEISVYYMPVGYGPVVDEKKKWWEFW